jgi:hypothetical protein
METIQFDKSDKGALFSMLMEAYSTNKQMVECCKGQWMEFDSFVYANLQIMNNNGFISVEAGNPIGFMSWDSRNLPESIEVGHNCIITKHKGLGKGKDQLNLGLSLMKERKPQRIIVKTGHTPFFIPARKMYESVGFSQKQILKGKTQITSEIVEYELVLC